MSRGPWKNPAAARTPRATVAKPAPGAEPVSEPVTAAPVTGAEALDALQNDLSAEERAVGAVLGREAAQSVGATIGQDKVLDDTLLEMSRNIAQMHPGQGETHDSNSEAVNARDTLMTQHLKRARMSAAADAGGELDPVSVWVKRNQQDESRMLGSDGRNLVQSGEVGQFISLDSPVDGKPGYFANYHKAIAEGARLVVGDDGKPVRNAFGVAVAWKIEDSAARLAAHNRLKYPREELDPTYQRRAQNRGGVLAVDIDPSNANFLDHDVEDAAAGRTGRRPQIAGNRFSSSVQKVPPELLAV